MGTACAGLVATCAADALAQPDTGPLSSAEARAEELGAGPNVGRQPRRSLDRLFDRQDQGDGARDAGSPGDGPPPQTSPADLTEPDDALGDDSDDCRLHVWMGVDFTTAYVSRGFVWEDSGLVVQPWADVWFDLWRGQSATLSLTAGTWSSLHAQATDAGTSDAFREHWYELDLYLGAAVQCGAWTFEGRYCWYTSPSDAWDTIEEVYLSAALDDSGWLGAWALNPTLLVAIETGDNANDGSKNGTYLQLGIEPGFALGDLARWVAGGGRPGEAGGMAGGTDDAGDRGIGAGRLSGVWVSFPISVGLSLDDYYESEDDDGTFEDTLGFASAGVMLAVPLAGEGGVLSASGRLGSWELTLGVQVVWLGEAAASFNEGDEVIVVGTMGVGVEF